MYNVLLKALKRNDLGNYLFLVQLDDNFVKSLLRNFGSANKNENGNEMFHTLSQNSFKFLKIYLNFAKIFAISFNILFFRKKF